MDEEILQELFNKDEQITKLQANMFALESANAIMRSTINNLINIKCKRGESSYALNIALDEALRRNLQSVDFFEFIRFNDNSIGNIAEYILTLLIGTDKHLVPCCILENQNILYKNEIIDTYVVCTCDEFFNKMYECVSNYACSHLQNEIDENTDDSVITTINMLLNKTIFLKIMKRVLQNYKTS